MSNAKNVNKFFNAPRDGKSFFFLNEIIKSFGKIIFVSEHEQPQFHLVFHEESSANILRDDECYKRANSGIPVVIRVEEETTLVDVLTRLESSGISSDESCCVIFLDFKPPLNNEKNMERLGSWKCRRIIEHITNIGPSTSVAKIVDWKEKNERQGKTMNTKLFPNLMEIGRLFDLEFNEKNDDRVKEWTGTEECATFARAIMDYANEHKCNVATAFYEIAEEVVIGICDGTFVIKDNGYDEYCRGFLAGEIIGFPTEENLRLVQEAEDQWKNGSYGYYQDVLNDVCKEIEK